MKKFTILLIIMLLYVAFGYSQVAINANGAAPESSAMLDVNSTTKGFLLPRMTTEQISYISSPAAGLMVYNTDSSDFYGYNGSEWVSLWNTGDTINPFVCGNPIVDTRDGKSYTTVQIGTQCWMAENLNIGTRIDGINNQTDNGTIEKYCWNDNANNCNIYGGLYQWNEMMQYITTEGTQGICPSGWHLPTDDEWKTMEMSLGMSQSQADTVGLRGTTQGFNMKSTYDWADGGNGDNSSGFNGLPGSRRLSSGAFGYDSNREGYWWSSSESSSTKAWCRDLNYGSDQVSRRDFDKTYGYSVRCIRD